MSYSAEASHKGARSIAQARVIDEKLLRRLVSEGEVDEIRAGNILQDTTFDSLIPGWRVVLAEEITESRWAELIGDLFGLASAELSDFTIDRDLFSVVPGELAERYQLLPLTRAGNEVYIGITDPREIDLHDHIRSLFGCPIRLLVIPATQIEKAVRLYYMAEDTSELEHVESVELSELSEQEIFRIREGGESGRIIELVDRIFAHAINSGASDIHIETYRAKVRIRFRVDGILRLGPSYPSALSPWIVSRIKVLAKLDISERHQPQDGRVRTKMSGVTVDMRVSSLPVAQGEKVVVRLLGHTRLDQSLDALGMDPEQLLQFREQLSRSAGLVLVTGPTGSGKSTTLYAAVAERHSSEVNIVTVEDPIEYEISGLNQVPVNPKRGVTFPNALRAILRQDPDVILVGEIRDPETGVIASEAAVTGHLVLSTLHTNDAASTVHRLLQMGVPKHLLAPSLQAVLAQRLLRAICPHCKMRYTASPTELDELCPGSNLKDIELVVGRGCGACDGSGYKGRIAIHELLVLDEHIRDLIGRLATTMEIRQYALSQGMKDLRTRALEQVFSGKTTSQELHRVVNN